MAQRPQAIPARVADRTRPVSRKEFPPGSRFAAGTRTPVSVMSALWMARNDALPWMAVALNPGVPRSTRKPWTAPSSPRAHTTQTSQIVPNPIQRLAPSRTYSSPSRRAVVASATASDPWSGSVSPNAPRTSRRAIGGSQRSFCSSEPRKAMERIARPAWTPSIVAKLPSPRDSSIVIRPAAVWLSAGIPGPCRPSPTRFSWAYSLRRSSGISARSQYPPATGITFSSTNARTFAQTSRSASVRSPAIS